MSNEKLKPAPMLGSPNLATSGPSQLSEFHQLCLHVKAMRDEFVSLAGKIGQIEYLLKDNALIHDSNQRLRYRLEAAEDIIKKKIYNKGLRDARKQASKRTPIRRKKPGLSKLELKRAGSRSKKG